MNYFFRNSHSKSILNGELKLILEKRNIELRKLLTHARNYSPWYRKILKNISIESFTHEHLKELPILTKSIFMENWDEIITDRSLNLKKVIRHLDKMSNTEEVLSLDNKYLVLATGGSSGKKGIFVYDLAEFTKMVDLGEDYLRKKLQPYLNLAPNEPMKTAQILVKNSAHIMYAASKLSKRKDHLYYHFSVNRPSAETIDGLNEVQPHRIVGLPSTIRRLCKSAQEGDLKIHPKVIVVGAEPLYKPIREMIYQTWPEANLFNNYGATERICAVNCKPNISYMHIESNKNIFFPVNKNNQIVKVGEYCDKLILTNLNGFILPLINYELEDKIRFIPDRCSCGSLDPLIEEPIGRTVNDFVYQGSISVHYLNFSTPLLNDGYVVEFHVMQTVKGVKINLVSNGPVKKNKIINSIQQSFTNLGLYDAQVEIVEVPKIDYLPTGKLQRFTPLI